MTITAVIITHNEERNIGRCLESLQGIADEIVVVDSGSTDSTEQICRHAGVCFERHEWEGFSGQKNYANSLATKEWVLSIDADEALSDQLRESILRLKSGSPADDTVYSFNRLTNYCGHWIRHCGWYPDRCCRLWRRGVARWDGIIHENLCFDGAIRHELLSGDLLHYSYYSVEEHVARLAKYAPLSAQKDFERGKRNGLAALVFKPLWTFVRGYFLKGGFRDGWAGFTVCRLSATYTLVKYAEMIRMEEKPLQKKRENTQNFNAHGEVGVPE